MKTIFPDHLSHRDRHQLLLGGVAPRPIAFVTTVDANNVVNLAPFSFFNAYSSRPPVVAIGPAIGGKSGIPKDTLLNLLATKECTISAISFGMVHKTNLASAPYPPEISEYDKSGFTQAASSIVRPPYVAESPYALECKLIQNIELFREQGGNGNIMLLEVVAFHVSQSVMDADGRIDPRRMDLVGRMGGSWYTRTRELFSTVQPAHIPIGFDALPDHIKHSAVLTGNDLAQLAYVPVLPTLDGTFPEFTTEFMADDVETELLAHNPMGALFVLIGSGLQRNELLRHRIAKEFIRQGMINEAWQTLLLV